MTDAFLLSQGVVILTSFFLIFCKYCAQFAHCRQKGGFRVCVHPLVSQRDAGTMSFLGFKIDIHKQHKDAHKHGHDEEEMHFTQQEAYLSQISPSPSYTSIRIHTVVMVQECELMTLTCLSCGLQSGEETKFQRGCLFPERPSVSQCMQRVSLCTDAANRKLVTRKGRKEMESKKFSDLFYSPSLCTCVDSNANMMNKWAIRLSTNAHPR